jgi:hypothetical protein
MDHESNDKPHDHGVHGMLLFGEESLYLSHLPMFMTIHDHQVILEVTLAHGEKDTHATYRADRQDTGELVYTLSLKSFPSTGLVLRDRMPYAHSRAPCIAATSKREECPF